MRSILVLFLAATAAFSVEDQWAKVRQLASGAEVRIYKRGAKQPLLGKLDETRDESIVIATKTEQIAIQKDDIVRIDARPVRTGGRITKETKTTSAVDSRPGVPLTPRETGVPSSSSSSTLTMNSKPDFETIYRRAPAAPLK